MKRLLILGAGIYQVPLIRRAVDAGFHVAAASWSPDDPGMSLVHEPWVVDTTDKEALLELARRKQVDAVATTGTDAAVPTIGYLCDHLGLPGIDYETALDCSNKIRMQERFAAAGVPAAAHRLAGTPEEAVRSALAIGFPVIVKAPNSSGSRGIAVAEKEDQIGKAFAAAAKVARGGQVLIERMLTGEEFGAQVIVVDGRVIRCLFHNDTVTPRPITVPIGHSCPSRLADVLRKEAFEVCQAAVDALGVRNAVCNADLIATADGIRVLEIGARIGATGIPEIIRLHYGLDLYEAALRLAMGERPEIGLTRGPASAVLIVRSSVDGRLARCRIPSDFDEPEPWEVGHTSSAPCARPAPRASDTPQDEQAVDIHFDYSEGDLVRKFRTGPDRIGHVVVVSDSSSEAEKFAERVVASLDVHIEPTLADDAALETSRPVDSGGLEGGDGF